MRFSDACDVEARKKTLKDENAKLVGELQKRVRRPLAATPNANCVHISANDRREKKTQRSGVEIARKERDGNKICA